MKDFILHLHLYLTDKESEQMAYENIKKLKQHGFTILITSPKPLPEYLYDIIDYFCYDKENQLMVEKYEGIEPTVIWTKTENIELRFVVTALQKHGLAVLRSMIKGCKVASMYGFKYIVKFEPDDCFGEHSMKLIEETFDEITKNDYHFYLFKNCYTDRRHDISVHLMYYRCDKFLEVFGNIHDEKIYNEYLANLGEAKQALILEQFILRALEKTTANVNVFYEAGETLINLYQDTVFNKYQSNPGAKDGVLSDVMVVRVNGEAKYNQIYLAAQNFWSDNIQRIHYDIFDVNDNLCQRYTFELKKGHWQYIPISLDNIKIIKIKHNDSAYHKVVSVDPSTKQIMCFEDGIKKELLSEVFVSQ
jgi:hypothetical protein